MRQLPQVLCMLDTSTKQKQVAASVSAAPACPTEEASAACCMSSCNFNKLKSCQKQSQTTCHQETRDKSPLDSPRCPQDKSWIHELLVTTARVLVMTPACPPVFLLDPDIFVFCILHLVCLCFKMKVEISWCVGCDGSFVEVSIGNSLNSTATLNRSICYKREHSRTRLRLINTRMATVKLHLSKPDTWNHEIYISWPCIDKSKYRPTPAISMGSESLW